MGMLPFMVFGTHASGVLADSYECGTPEACVPLAHKVGKSFVEAGSNEVSRPRKMRLDRDAQAAEFHQHWLDGFGFVRQRDLQRAPRCN